MDTSGWDLPVRRVERHPQAGLDPASWPATVPAVAQLLRDGLELGPVTVLVGENGSGKSTVVEAIAEAFGLNPEGGSVHARHTTRRSESGLAGALRLARGPGASRWRFFLRAETMHSFYTYLETGAAGSSRDPVFHELSHGESFMGLLGTTRFTGSGFYVMDEPESALSFTNCLALVGALHDLAASGTSQVVVATHSPVIAALPGARILALDDGGLHDTSWDDLALVAHWRSFLDSPQRYLRHVLAPD